MKEKQNKYELFKSRTDAKKQYIYTFEASQNDVIRHYNYGFLLHEVGCKVEAKKYYQFSIE
jgi:hypothetical protein